MSGDGGGKRIGMREVAEAAGVSPQTVSRVLNDYPGIRDATRERVLTAVAALDYRVNNAARALGTSLTRTVGVVASDAVLHGPSAGIAALERAARARGRWISTAYTDSDDPADIDAAVRHLLDQGVDGIVLVAAHGATPLEGYDVPLVPLYGESGIRQRDAAALVVDHLADLGHRRIVEVAGPPDWREALARTAGVADALARRGLAREGRVEGDWSAGSGAAVADAVAAHVRRGATAVAVANDQMALGLMAGLAARGITVPADVSVAGFDDNPDAAFYTPALTTVRLDVEGEAAEAVARVLGDEPTAPAQPVLVPRASTAAPR
ncbi:MULTISPECIES: LacI family DNA-binding transcriptional regulator [Microbacterium]|jgi:DNA-binding LacI/PurR family transcriptional regulator|uniref:LacI family DNA-binding transcriptional regulator n=1 Tax=Microbacterium TaxID=33882 RepID=UPI00278A8768|nr:MULTISPECIES: LacI family DNA-binding transcriptional regulator [Microbacterium]MDF2919071.1 transcriptional regulator [Microbacterium sp.]MDQ1075656.1 DNA-binding LacI/PurR family transcriptional regulator [Microbacterium sp. SORGH_AS_0969]MDQ1115898.1 DNA-binding LacI/PurR family transcriptional regulator [Microbacterium testaceum]